MLKNMRVFIAYCVFFNPGREIVLGMSVKDIKSIPIKVTSAAPS